MYSLNVEPPNEHYPVIKRSMSANKANDLVPVVVAICEAEFHWLNAVALYMGNNVYRIFDLNNPYEYAKVSIVKDAN